MTKFLISFPGSAMSLSPDDFVAAGVDAHAVIREAKAAGVYVFGGGIDEDVAPVMVSGDGAVTAGTYPQTREFDGGFCVLELPSREDAEKWAAKIAAACRCDQELREFMYDPES
jgi:hypothetical protein